MRLFGLLRPTAMTTANAPSCMNAYTTRYNNAALTPRGVPATIPMSMYPACAMEEYASIRFTFVCVSAARLPIVIERTDRT